MAVPRAPARPPTRARRRRPPPGGGPGAARRPGPAGPAGGSRGWRPPRLKEAELLRTQVQASPTGGEGAGGGAGEEPEARAEASAEEVTEKYGLEAGLFRIFQGKAGDGSGKSRTEQAKGLFKTYGPAYLLTSISFAVVSFSLCYALVSAGVDVAGLLKGVGLEVSDKGEKVTTAALAYAAHKAASPIRFPPTVALTPVVAKWIGREKGDSGGAEEGEPGT